MKTRNLLIAALVLLALSGVLYWSKKHPSASDIPAADTSPKIAEIPETSVQQILIAPKNGQTVTLQRTSGKWAITAPEPLPADQDAVASALAAVNPLTADTVVQDNTANLQQYGLQPPAVTVTLGQNNGKTTTFAFGNDVAVGSSSYLEANGKVYSVTSSAKSSLNKTANDLRDKRLLTFDTNKLTSVDLGNIEFAKNNQGDWQIVRPQPSRADSFQVEELIRKLGDAKMDLTAPADPSKFSSGSTLPLAKVSDASGTETLEVHKNKEDYFARSSAVKGIFKVSSDVGTELTKSIDDFRNKKVFDFGFNDPIRIDTPQGTLLRSGSDWKLNGKTMDPGQVQSFIDKLRDLAATKLSAAPFASPVFSVTVVSNDGKRTEKVDIAKTTTGYAAKRENEPTVYEFDQSTGDDLIKAPALIKPAKK